MKQFQYTIKDELGVHARPAGLLVKLAKQYTSAITIEMGMGIRQGETITVTAEGEDEAAAIEAVEKFLTENV